MKRFYAKFDFSPKLKPDLFFQFSKKSSFLASNGKIAISRSQNVSKIKKK